MAEDSPFDVTKEALWTLTNIILIGDKIQANYTVNHGSIPALCRFIDPPRDTKLVIVVLEAIEKLLAYNRVTNLDYIEIFEQCNGDLKLEEIQKYDNDRTYEMAVHILKTYFEGEEEVSDENLAPNVSECNTAFDFGVGLPSKQLFPETNSGLTAQTMQFDFTMS